MYKNTAGQTVDVALVLRADGNDATGLTPTVRIKKDGTAWAASGGTVTEGENGSYQYAPTQAETDCDHLVVKVTSATALTVLVNLYPIEVALYKADVSSLALEATSQSIGTTVTDTNLRVQSLNDFDPATDEVTTDTASREASKADVSALATATELAKVIKSGEQANYVSDLGSKAVTATRV